MAESTTSNNTSFNEEECTEEDPGVITMVDVLREEEDREEDAKAVLGASDDKNCTYSKGYVKRQALYACMTCTPMSGDGLRRGGVCLACSYHCHEGHELIELYTKRNFRCDCGNSRYNNKCNLEPSKSAVNELNIYNQNFRGLYCTCNRPYPDPENEREEEMIQCIICEDWYHDKHLESEIPLCEKYTEMVCTGCIGKHSFLRMYRDYILPEKMSVCTNVVDNSKPHPGMTDSSDNSNIAPIPGAEQTKVCLIKDKVPEVGESGALFLVEGWRQQLCRCEACVDLYQSESLSFLLDHQDPVHVYEEEGKVSSQETQYEAGMRALSSLGRVQQVEAIQEYNDMKVQLKEYLQKFAENKKVVREEDIREFFSGMEARKKSRVEVQPQYFCR